MDKFEFSFSERLSIFESTNPWYFFEIPKKESSIVRNKYRNVHRGWGSIPVTAQIGETSWKTSIFWEKKGNYLLFVKKEIRSKEKLINGSKVDVTLSVDERI